MAIPHRKNVNKYFPESEETQNGHMQNQRQRVRSTKVKIKIEDKNLEKKQKEIEKLTKERDIYIKVYEAKDTMYTDQTGKFSVISSRGNKYMRA